MKSYSSAIVSSFLTWEKYSFSLTFSATANMNSCCFFNSFWGGWCEFHVVRSDNPSLCCPVSRHGPARAHAAAPLTDDVFAATQSGANIFLPPPRRHQLFQELLLHRERRRREDGPLQQPAAHRDPPGYSQWHETRVPGLQPHNCSPSKCFCGIASPGWVGSIT